MSARLTQQQAAAALAACRAQCEGRVIPPFEQPGHLGRAMVVLTRISGGVTPAPITDLVADTVATRLRAVPAAPLGGADEVKPMPNLMELLNDEQALREVAQYEGLTPAKVRRTLEAAQEAQRLARVAEAVTTLRNVPQYAPAMARSLLGLDDEAEKNASAPSARVDVVERRNGVRSALYEVCRALRLVESGAKHDEVREALLRLATAGELPAKPVRTARTRRANGSGQPREMSDKSKAVLEALPGTKDEIGERTGLDMRAVAGIVNVLNRSGHCVEGEGGVWRRAS